MPIEFKITESGPTPRHVRAAERGIRKRTWQHLADHWFRRFRPKHFTHRGAKEYGYKPRKGHGLTGKAFRLSYEGQKLTRKGHTYPLVWSGVSKQRATLGRITATSQRARVSMSIPAFNFRNPNSEIDMREEMETISRAEERDLTDRADRHVAAELQQIQTKTTKTIRP